jgi:hypothetical protein
MPPLKGIFAKFKIIVKVFPILNYIIKYYAMNAYGRVDV